MVRGKDKRGAAGTLGANGIAIFAVADVKAFGGGDFQLAEQIGEAGGMGLETVNVRVGGAADGVRMKFECDEFLFSRVVGENTDFNSMGTKTGKKFMQTGRTA